MTGTVFSVGVAGKAQDAWLAPRSGKRAFRTRGQELGEKLGFLPADGVHFEQAAVGNFADANADPGGAVVAHEVGVDLVEAVEVVHVLKEDGSLGDIGDGESGSVKFFLEVGQGLFGLGFDVVSDHFTGDRVEGHLSAQVVGVSALHAVGVGTDSGGRLWGVEFHVVFLEGSCLCCMRFPGGWA